MNYLVSYPRSGNTWLRYCLEVLTNERTIGYIGSSKFESGILESNREKNDYFLIKRHQGEEEIENSKDNRLILLVRNYDEVLIRHNLGQKLTIIEHSKNPHPVNYIKILQFYEDFIGEKVLIYYEDLMKNPKKEIIKCIGLLGLDISKESMDDFFDNIEQHKNKSIEIYGGSQTNGNTGIHHSTILSDKEKRKNREFLEKNYNNLYEKYLRVYDEF